MTKSFEQVIASRELAHAALATPVVVEIGVPRRRRTSEWACPYRILGLGPRGTRYAFGFDAVQSLQLVNQAIWRDLEPHEQQLDWLGEPGDTGFFRFFPMLFGVDHAKRVEAAIDREIRKESLRLERRRVRARAHRKRRRSRAAKPLA